MFSDDLKSKCYFPNYIGITSPLIECFSLSNIGDFIINNKFIYRNQRRLSMMRIGKQQSQDDQYEIYNAVC